ncbi:enkurin domain-containing protein 1 [Latimeria chalumnae]|uniref:Enkurin domain containing 1 n=1 Tax=Latimeria chalumnae TaxID=7897 RepID=H3B594_LATCH|nr:PREDICTED: enkurin domain-containing protein 1 [Latimeria chalumnae]XP_005998648.1 PREDICTED: enkurin domain-containing protein 1 [Latimeria chalumnae]|eukprot:XP_005998647.1 PREDICTED: enkurin domain-containing protein 1 [Latimeria chalumnae]
MSEGPSKISGPIPPDPTLFPEYYKRPASARGRLEGNTLKLDFLSGPLAPDPTLYPTCYSARPAQPPPRVRPNAKEYLDKGQKGSVGVLLQLEGISLQRNSPPKRRDPKDHEKENVRRMREIQKKCKEKELEREHNRPMPVKALWKSQKYECVESKVMTKLQESSPSKKLEFQNFLKAHSRCGTGLPPRRSLSPTPSKTTAPVRLDKPVSGNSTELQIKGVNVDFVSYNARNAKRTSLQRSRSLQSLTEVLERKQKDQEEYNTKQKGQIPQYLLERKDQWRREAEERQRKIPDPSMPPGHTMMPECERQETLNSMKQTQQQLIKQLLMMPVRADTLSAQNCRTELEKKLSEIEEAIKIFSRPKVFIKVDS